VRLPGRTVAATALLLVLAGGVLTGCGIGAPPQVVFTVGDTRLSTRPARYCDEALTSCDDDATAPVHVELAPGTPLGVEVPEDVAATPWHVVFCYRSAAGEPVEARSAVFRPGERTRWELALPDARARLLTAEVQQFAPTMQTAPNGEVAFPIRASWVLVTPALREGCRPGPR